MKVDAEIERLIEELSPVGRPEGVKYLAARDRDRLLAAYRER